MENDLYGRTVTKIQDEVKDIYVVHGDDDQEFIVSFPKGHDVNKVFDTINAMAPANWEG